MRSEFFSTLKSQPNDILTKLLVAGILINACYFYYLTFPLKKTELKPLLVSNSCGGSGVPELEESLTPENFREYVRPLDKYNSSAIFNTINDAMKQKNCDIHSVGVSFIPAVIPQGTLLYHAGKGEVPSSFEWVAFDHEFSLIFGSRAQPRGRESLNNSYHRVKKDEVLVKKTRNRRNRRTWSLASLMTFQTTRDLNKVIYIDGGSAAKTTTGELDTQELWSNVVGGPANKNDTFYRIPERIYARQICEWGKPLGLDGFIRVELGFEMVVCDFTNGLKLVSNTTIIGNDQTAGLPPAVPLTKENGWPINENGELIEDELTEEQQKILDQEDVYHKYLTNANVGGRYDHVRAGNFHDSGERRVKLDFRYMVTGINRTWLDPNTNARRLVSDSVPESVHTDLVNGLKQSLSMESGFNAALSNDWQNIVREIIGKFSPMLQNIRDSINRNYGSPEERATNAYLYYINFIKRFQDVNTTLEQNKELAVYQYSAPVLPLKTDSDFLIFSAVVNVVREVVDALFDIHSELNPLVLSYLKGETHKNAQQAIRSVDSSIRELIQYLQWVELNYRCEEDCGTGGVCYTPSWGPSAFGWVTPNDKDSPNFGLKWQDSINRYEIDKNQKCVNLDTMLSAKWT